MKNFANKWKGAVDRYAKKLHTPQLIALAQLEQQRGLRDVSHSLHDDQLSQAISLDSISASQISRRLRDLPIEVLQSLFHEVKVQAGKELGFDAVGQELGRLRLAVITPAKPADRTQMDALALEEEDALNVFDRGCVDYKKFDRHCENRIRFVTPLKGNAVIEVLEEFPTSPDSPVKRERIVRLGNEGVNKMKHLLRRVETEEAQGNPVVLITNDLPLRTFPSLIRKLYRRPVRSSRGRRRIDHEAVYQATGRQVMAGRNRSAKRSVLRSGDSATKKDVAKCG